MGIHTIVVPISIATLTASMLSPPTPVVERDAAVDADALVLLVEQPGERLRVVLVALQHEAAHARLDGALDEYVGGEPPFSVGVGRGVHVHVDRASQQLARVLAHIVKRRFAVEHRHGSRSLPSPGSPSSP